MPHLPSQVMEAQERLYGITGQASELSTGASGNQMRQAGMAKSKKVLQIVELAQRMFGAKSVSSKQFIAAREIMPP